VVLVPSHLEDETEVAQKLTTMKRGQNKQNMELQVWKEECMQRGERKNYADLGVQLNCN
jgi:hypothetical protein